MTHAHILSKNALNIATETDQILKKFRIGQQMRRAMRMRRSSKPSKKTYSINFSTAEIILFFVDNESHSIIQRYLVVNMYFMPSTVP